MSKKKLIVAAASLAMVATLAIGGTLAYFSDSDEKKNVIKMGNVGITLVEDSDSDKVTEAEELNGIKYTEVMPGDVLSKDVDVVVDTDSRDAYIAIKVNVVGTFEENQEAVDLPSLDVVEGWEEVEEGFYVYKEAVSAEAVIHFFNTVSVPTSWTEAHDFDIELTAYAIQAENTETVYVEELKKLAGLVNNAE